VPEGLDLLNPGTGAVASAIVASFLTTGLVGLAAALIAAYVRPLWMRAGLVILGAALMATDAATPGAFLRDAGFYLVVIVALWAGITRIVRFNVMGYFLLAAIVALVPRATELLNQSNPYFHVNGYAVLAFALALLSWPLICWRRNVNAA
jgi:hypothetical protein